MLSKIEKQSIIDAYSTILNNYFSNFIESDICCQEQNYYANINFDIQINRNLFTGLGIINRIFEYVLLKTKNVSSTYYYTNDSISYFLEYLEQIYKANFSYTTNNIDTDTVLFVYKKTILELFENDNKNNNINIGGKSILSNIIQSNSNFNNLEHIPKQDIKDFCLLIFKITNLLLSWKNTLENINLKNNKYSYILRIESCLKLLDNFMKNIDNMGLLIECLEIFYQNIHISHSVWIKLLEEILLDISKKNKKKEFKDIESFLLFFNMEKGNIQESINKGELIHVINKLRNRD
jgi:hypothetical protein